MQSDYFSEFAFVSNFKNYLDIDVMDQKKEKNLQDQECFHFNPEVENVVSFGLNYIN